MATGFVYILHNPYLMGSSGIPLLKIGGTARSALARALELSAATGVPGRFSVVYEAAAPNWQRLEAAVHRALNAHRRAGEFFEVGPEEAIAVIEKLLQQTKPAQRRDFDHGHPPSFRYAGKVHFVPAQSGFAVWVEGMALGTLIVTDETLRYELLSEISRECVLEVDLAPHLRQRERIIAAQEAKCRAAWIALILKRFTTPVFTDLSTDESRLVSVNGLAIAQLMQRRHRQGLLIRRETVEYDLEPACCPRGRRLEDNFGATTTIIPRDRPPHPERLFVPFAQTDLETSVRHYLLDQTLADGMFLRDRWTCHLTLLNCEVKLVLTP